MSNPLLQAETSPVKIPQPTIGPFTLPKYVSLTSFEKGGEGIPRGWTPPGMHANYPLETEGYNWGKTSTKNLGNAPRRNSQIHFFSCRSVEPLDCSIIYARKHMQTAGGCTPP